MPNAYRDENDVPTLIAVSILDGQTPVRLWADPITHRLLVDSAGGGGGGFTKLTATGTRNGSNTVFTFTTATQPSFIVSDGVWLTNIDDNGSTQWTWNSGAMTATMVVPPNVSLFGVQ